MRAGLRFDDLRAIFLTHLHADHVADYYNFFLLAGGLPNSRNDVITTPVPVYGPGPAGALPAKFGGGQAPRFPHVWPHRLRYSFSMRTLECHRVLPASRETRAGHRRRRRSRLLPHQGRPTARAARFAQSLNSFDHGSVPPPPGHYPHLPAGIRWRLGQPPA
ncbi:hypothetical protein [Streptomyces sp. NPDC056160]|uniref:hypothetical protein n=1 Tax=Streptomyces sp. NPDC056160 TaxID=3345731 RepID=UPI0035DF1684